MCALIQVSGVKDLLGHRGTCWEPALHLLRQHSALRVSLRDFLRILALCVPLLDGSLPRCSLPNGSFPSDMHSSLGLEGAVDLVSVGFS